MRPITAIVLGAGQRGADAYAGYALRFPDELKIVGAAEPCEERRLSLARLHGIPKERCYPTWEDALAVPKFADCVFVCTQDRMHCGPVLAALGKGYDVLCEKPMSPDKKELLQMRDAARESGHLLSICHVLRYSPFFAEIQNLLGAGAIGQLVSIQHIESVGYWHMAHSFVRGSWRRADESCPMIIAKCCHDLDLLRWLADSPCQSVSSVGSLVHFTAAHAPQDAPAYCLDGCAHRDECPYYAPRFYLEHPRAVPDGFVRAVSLDPSPEAVLEALRRGLYGRCVYRCDNDVVDNQLVNLTFANGVTASLTMCAFTDRCERIINLMGSRGQLRGNLEDSTLELLDFASGSRTIRQIHTPEGGHSGSDAVMMREFLRTLRAGAADSRSSAAVSVESHLMALAAEQSRLRGGVPVRLQEEEA